MLFQTLTSGNYAFSTDAFSHRALNILDVRGLTTLAAAQTALSSMTFTAGGFLQMKKLLAELILGSTAFPNEINAAGLALQGITEAQISARDVSAIIT